MKINLLSAPKMLARVTPTELVVAVTAVRPSDGHGKPKLGFAVSDPYLSHAMPLPEVSPTLESLPKCIEELAKTHNVGGVVVAPPVVMDPTAETEATWFEDEQAIVAALLDSESESSEPSPYFPMATSEEVSDLDHVRTELEYNLLWETLELDNILEGNNEEDLTPSKHAGVALQLWLDRHLAWGGFA